MASPRIGPPGAPVVVPRDRRTLEIRQFFPIPRSGMPPSEYTLDSWLYFPRSFNVNAVSWTHDAFYRDTRIYIRLHAPALTLLDLADLDHPQNSGAMLRRKLSALLDEHAPPASSMSALAQMYGSELSDAAINEGRALLDLLDTVELAAEDDAASFESHAQALEEGVRAFTDGALRALGSVRRIRAKAVAYQAVAHASLFSSLAFAEEFASAMIDERLAKVGERVDASAALRDGTGLATRLRLEIARCAEAVNTRRLEQGFGVPWGSSPEYFTYRIGLIKKEVQRALYIDTRSADRDPFLVNSAAMVAAGLAATWATLAQLPLWTGGWNTSNGVYFLFVAVGAYVLKDRIKEWTRNVLVKRFLSWDHNKLLLGNTLERVGMGSFQGRAKERMCFVSENEIPAEIQAVRQTHRTVKGVLSEMEEVVHYKRVVTLEADEAHSVPTGLGVQELIRISLDRVIKQLDDPLDTVAFYDGQTGRFVSAEMPKVYHLNLVLQATEKTTGEQTLLRVRVVVNQKGIVRVDDVFSENRGTPVAPGRLAA